MEIKEKKKFPFFVLIDTLLNKGETDSDVELPAELKQNQQDIDSRLNKFYDELQAPAKKGGKKSKLDEELKVDSSNRVKSDSKRKNAPSKSDKEDKELEQ